MRTKSFVPGLTLLGLPLLAACGGDRVAVQVMSETPEGELTPVSDVEVQFLPFDRDSLFDSLADRAESPEPAIPDTLRALYEQVAARQQAWRQAEARWQTVRDSMKRLSQQMQGMDQSSEAYMQRYQAFTRLEEREQGLNGRRQRAFEAFDSLQQATIAVADSVEAVRDAWAQEAFRGFLEIQDSIVEARGAEIRADTTGDDGWASAVLRGGPWWVHTRFTGPYEELYWNVRIDPAETDTLRLTPENAERRLAL